MGYTTTLGAFGLGDWQDWDPVIPPLVKSAGASSLAGSSRQPRRARRLPFRLAVINDEITQDFERACQIVQAISAALD